MGWDFTLGASRADVIRDRTKRWESESQVAECEAHCTRGNVLWTVWEHTDKATCEVTRYIGCDLLQGQKGYGWGYKDMCESMHPYYYTCPERYLDLVPVACEEWREMVRKRAADRRRKVKTGERYAIPGSTLSWVEIESVRPLRGVGSDGRLYRVSKGQLGECLAS